MRPVPVVIDCDPGHDDAMALLLALASPELDVLGVTTVAGNTTLDKTTANALRVLERAGRTDVGVAPGSAQPLSRALVVAEDVHGPSGLDGPTLADPVTSPEPFHAIEKLRQAIDRHPEPVTVITLGPLTNLALFLRLYPESVPQIQRVVSMGGSIGLGNVTPAAEFNIFVDPEAARAVYSAGLDVTMIGLDVTHRALIDSSHAELLAQEGECGRFVAELLEFFLRRHPRTYERAGVPIHDALAVAHVIWPDLVETAPYAVTIDCTDGPSRGRTYVDRWGVTAADPNSTVGINVDGRRFAELLVERLARLP